MKITFLKCCSIALAMLLTSEIIYATPISIQFGGTVTQFDSSGVVNGIAVNNAFQVIVAYDDAAIDTIATAEAGRYLGGINPGMIVTSGVNQFTISGPMRVWTEDNVQDGFTAQWDGLDASFAWGDGRMDGNAALTL